MVSYMVSLYYPEGLRAKPATHLHYDGIKSRSSLGLTVQGSRTLENPAEQLDVAEFRLNVTLALAGSV